MKTAHKINKEGKIKINLKVHTHTHNNNNNNNNKKANKKKITAAKQTSNEQKSKTSCRQLRTFWRRKLRTYWL